MTPLAFEISASGTLALTAMLYQADRASRLDALFVLAHGAGAGQSHPFMVRYARGLADRGVDVVTFDFPYMQAGRRSPDRVPVLEESFRHVIVTSAAHRQVSAARLFIGGKSMGGRIATHLAAAPDAWPENAPRPSGVVVFGYPLAPPGGSKRSPDRVSHLRALAAPTLIVQGTRDSFGGPDDIRRALGGTSPTIEIHEVAGGDHSFNVPKSTRRSVEDVDRDVWDRVIEFVRKTG